MLSKKSPQRNCGIEIWKERIQENGFLNQDCVLASDLESIFLGAPSENPFSTASARLGPRAMSPFPPLSGGLCCKTIFSTPARKIDSRSRSQPQHRFKSGRSRIRLFQIPIPQTSVGDFCNTIGGKADVFA